MSSMNKIDVKFWQWDDFYVRVFRKGFSVQPVKPKYHTHPLSARKSGLWKHHFGYCWRLLK